ncbi:DUF885 domain-containing protein [Sphingomonas profundi]|uniref:DUF885 domain-containing protein n=1 Tax=Alterirhizorhabdus profundi TaxID=2681549 RepID=UPI0012E7C88D|nr:DUF885 domain-containing protein [Sphingomonas profundi]
MRLALAALLLAVAAPAAATPADDLNRLIERHWAWYLKNNPVMATRLGERRYDDQLDDLSLAGMDRRAAEAKGFVARLDAIPDASLTPAQRGNKAILRRLLSEQVEANGFGQRMMLFTNRNGPHQDVASLGDYVPLLTKADYVSLVTRYEKYPAVNAEMIAVTKAAVAGGYTLPCEAMAGFEKTISGLIVTDPTKARAYEPFTRARPADATAAEWSALQARARAAITGSLNPANTAFLAFYTRDYAPKCAKSPAASAEPGGAAYYAFRVRQQTTTTLTPDQIHALGLSEVARIRGEMDALAAKAGYPSRAAFIARLRTDPVYYAKTPEELMRANARVAKIIDGKMPSLFGYLPRLPYTLREIPAETAEGTTTAYYTDGNLESGLPGTYWVNTSKLDQRPFFEIPALTVHEAVPGHHQQISVQQELDLPPFRKYAAFFTAFVEGWGLYSERLGIEMGLYDTPEKDMGRLSYEMWRACRLVVDTGIHAKGWTKAQAIAFMTDNSALSAANIEAEVNRYIANPGQALAYKLGELKIRELRARAEKALGPKFDLRRFHDVVLGQGAVPLDVLDAQVQGWIDGQAGGAAAS